MAGGTFNVVGEKILPGGYVNVISAKSNAFRSESSEGVVFLVLDGLGWGPSGLSKVSVSSNFKALFGVEVTHEKLSGLYQALLTAPEVIVYNLNAGTKAVAPDNHYQPWNFTAKHPGTFGNNISVVVAPSATNPNNYIVQTMFEQEVVDVQEVNTPEGLHSNAFIEVTIKTGQGGSTGTTTLRNLRTAVTRKLAGGTNTSTDRLLPDLVNAIETSEFDVVTAAGIDGSNPIHAMVAESAINLREVEGKKVQAVLPVDAPGEYDNEGIIVVANGLVLKDGKVLNASQSAGYVAGATAAATASDSLTFKVHPSAIDVSPRFNKETRINKIKQGQMVFIAERGKVKIETDINSLHTYPDGKSKDFSKNRTLRVLDEIANNTRLVWEDHFIGKISNNADGRDLFKANRAEFLSELQAKGAIENFEMKDIVVERGRDKDSVVVTIAVQPTDAMEKLYATVIVN